MFSRKKSTKVFFSCRTTKRWGGGGKPPEPLNKLSIKQNERHATQEKLIQKLHVQCSGQYIDQQKNVIINIFSNLNLT